MQEEKTKDYFYYTNRYGVISCHLALPFFVMPAKACSDCIPPCGMKDHCVRQTWMFCKKKTGILRRFSSSEWHWFYYDTVSKAGIQGILKSHTLDPGLHRGDVKKTSYKKSL